MKTKDTKDILLFTRPLSPPWDEASKNLGYDLALNFDTSNPFNFHLLTTKKYARTIKKLRSSSVKNLIPEPIFTSSSFDKRTKMQLIARLFRPRIGCDLIHFLFTPRPLTSLIFKTRLYFSKVKSIQTLATISDDLLRDPQKLKKVLFGDEIIAQSHITEKKLLKAGIKNVQVLYPGINFEKHFPQKKSVSLLEKLGLKKNDLIVLFAGEYTRLKAIDDIISAFENIFQNKDSKNIHLVLACRIKSPEDKEKQKLVQKRAKDEGYLNRLIFLETVEDMPELYNISDINIFPVQEMAGKFDIPLALIEAMACKKAMIVSDIDVLTEFVEDEKTGLVIGKGKPSELESAVLKLAQDSTKRMLLGQNAFDYVHRNFDIKSVVKQYNTVYTKLLNND